MSKLRTIPLKTPADGLSKERLVLSSWNNVSISIATWYIIHISNHSRLTLWHQCKFIIAYPLWSTQDLYDSFMWLTTLQMLGLCTALLTIKLPRCSYMSTRSTESKVTIQSRAGVPWVNIVHTSILQNVALGTTRTHVPLGETYKQQRHLVTKPKISICTHIDNISQYSGISPFFIYQQYILHQ